MLQLRSKDIARIIDAKIIVDEASDIVNRIAIDSRKPGLNQHYAFIAFPGTMRDGHNYIEDAYQKGVRHFIVTKEVASRPHTNTSIYLVKNPIAALQKLAAYHRKKLNNTTIIAITGSNGKTIIKEWLYQMLSNYQRISKSPGSYNSQIGVPLSLTAIDTTCDLAIIEAGISKPGEMKNHLKSVAPNIGIFSNLGGAHDAGFSDRVTKLNEKLILFESCQTIIYSKDQTLVAQQIERKYGSKNLYSWGFNKDSSVVIESIEPYHKDITISIKAPFPMFLYLKYTDKASIENALHSISCMIYLGYDEQKIQQALNRLHGIDMRLERKDGINGCTIIDDSYSADLQSLEIALDFLNNLKGNQKSLLVISEMDQSGMTDEVINQSITKLINEYKVQEVWTVGNIKLPVAKYPVKSFDSVDLLLDFLNDHPIHNRTILIKGARRFEMERVSKKLTKLTHSVKLITDLSALEHNVRIFKSQLHHQTKMMGVVKAGAYGAGAVEIAHTLFNTGVDALAVAFTDEAIQLRKSQISLPILVLNPAEQDLSSAIQYNLDIVVHRQSQLKEIITYEQRYHCTIRKQIKVDTGMHRLGFVIDEIPELCNMIQANNVKGITGIFSHLAASDDEKFDEYSNHQFTQFDSAIDQLLSVIQEKPVVHILNSGGIPRFENRQYDMVRLGIGMYGIGNHDARLRKVHQLEASLISIKKLPKGSSIGYNRSHILTQDSIIGVINIGYADGLFRLLGNGKYKVLINGQWAPIIGHICMDISMIDLTNCQDVQEGDRVCLFGESHPIEGMAKVANTIPYEILTRIAPRVVRVFHR